MKNKRILWMLAACTGILFLSGCNSEAKKTYNYVRKHNGRPPNGYVGGNKFVNDGRFGGEVLPRTTLYREYDIYPRIRGINRGGERIVIGGDGSGWYTSDHYMTFLRFR